MYRDHVPTIAYAMQSDLATFQRGVMFALLSARVQFPRVPDQCIELADKGRDARCLWGWKFDAYCYLQENAPALWEGIRGNGGTLEAKFETICQIPGMGLVKGAFVLQLMGYDVACLDTRNIARDGRNPRAYRSDGEARKRMKSFGRKIARYVADTQGKAEFYWNVWCKDVAEFYGITADEISALHLTSIVPKSQRNRQFTVPIVVGEIPF